MYYLILKSLIQFVDSVLLVFALISYSATSVSFILVDNKVSSSFISVYSKCLGLFIVNANKESCYFRIREVPFFIPVLQIFNGLWPVCILMGRVRSATVWSFLLGVFICISAVIALDLHGYYLAFSIILNTFTICLVNTSIFKNSFFIKICQCLAYSFTKSG